MTIHDEEERDMIDVTDNDMKPGTPLWRSSPEELWLAVGDEPEDWLYELTDCVDVTWAADFCPVSVGVGYVRADLYDTLRARVAELERERDHAVRSAELWEVADDMVRDAYRYRFLRDNPLRGEEEHRPFIHAPEGDRESWAWTGDMADERIDAMLAAKANGGS